MTRRFTHPVTRLVAGALAALALAGAAEALDLRAWDQAFKGKKRFVVLEAFDGDAVLDRETQLVWERAPGLPTAIWGAASQRCVRLLLGGRLGWRLPTVQELATLLHPGVPNPGLSLPPGHPFEDVQPFPYWTATASFFFVNGAKDFWQVGFSNGGGLTELEPAGQGQQWCVRGGSGVDTQ